MNQGTEFWLRQWESKLDPKILTNMRQRLGVQGQFINTNTPHSREMLNAGGQYTYWVISGEDAEARFPELSALYDRTYRQLREDGIPDIEPSPYDDSRIAVKQYPEGYGQQSYHGDTNPISVLLFMTTNYNGGELVFPYWGIRVRPEAGRMIAFPGRVPHFAEIPRDTYKAIACLNYYRTDDFWRPEGLDQMIYGT